MTAYAALTPAVLPGHWVDLIDQEALPNSVLEASSVADPRSVVQIARTHDAS